MLGGLTEAQGQVVGVEDVGRPVVAGAVVVDGGAEAEKLHPIQRCSGDQVRVVHPGEPDELPQAVPPLLGDVGERRVAVQVGLQEVQPGPAAAVRR